MNTLIRNTGVAVLVLLMPTVASGESLADRKLDTPVEAWNSEELELERAILTETIEPTAAGHSLSDGSASNSHSKTQSSGEMSGMSIRHGTKAYGRASDYKREIFGPN